MRNLIQLIVMFSDVAIILACAIALYTFNFNVLSLLLVAMTLWTWKEQGGFMAWRPTNIRKFMANMKAVGI